MTNSLSSSPMLSRLLCVLLVTHLAGLAHGQDPDKRPYSTGDIEIAPMIYDQGQVAAEARFLHQVDELRKLVEPELSGKGITVGVWDGGLVLEHNDLKGRVTHADTKWKRLNDHATHVGGTIAGNGLGKEAARGMASQAKLLSYSYADGDDPMLSDDLAEMKNASGIRISNHSYGRIAGWHTITRDPDGSNQLMWVWAGSDSEGEDPLFGMYTGSSADYDAFAHERPEWTVVVAAGNSRSIVLDPRRAHLLVTRSGYDWLIPFDLSFDGTHLVPKPGLGFVKSKIKHPSQTSYDTTPGGLATAKNVITVGNMADLPIEQIGERLTPNMVKPHQSSSMGPTDDGRIKPDIIANGDVVLATTLPPNSDGFLPEQIRNDQRNAYGQKTGTSMAAPVVSGILALLNQLSELKRELPLRSDESKAVLVHTAISPTNKPRYDIGWGAVDAKTAGTLVYPDYYDGQSLQRIEVSKDEPHEIQLKRGGPLLKRITLAWLDLPGEPQRGLNSRDSVLVDDLDMRLTSPSGVEFKPWTLDPDAPEAEAKRGDNHRDNLERIDLEASEDEEDGVWRLRISLKDSSKSNEVAAALCIWGFEIDDER